jgi:putative ABC transport system permease protein
MGSLVSCCFLVDRTRLPANTLFDESFFIYFEDHEYGVLRAIGFMPRHLAMFVLGEASVIGLIGGVIGVGTAYPFVNQGVGQVVEENFASVFPYFRMEESDALLALLIAIGVAMVASAIPAYRASKLDVIDALRRVG